MGRAQQKETNRINDTTRQQSTSQYNDFNRDQSRMGQEYLNNSRSSFGGASDVYSNLAKGFGPGDQNYATGPSSGGSGVSARGYTAHTYDPTGYEAKNYRAEDYKAKTYNAEGYNADQYTAEGYQSKQPQYHLKGIDPSNLADAKAGYGEFAQTGGMSEGDRNNYRLRGNATLPSFYSNLKNNLATRRNVQGGYGSGFDAADSALARQGAQATYQGALNTEGSLQDRITAGRQFGIGGQADIGKFQDDLQLRHDTSEGNFAEAYAGRQDTAGMFSAGARNTANQFNTGARNAANEFSTGARNRAAEVNTSAENAASQFGANARNTANQFNTGATNQALQFGAGAKNDAGQFNANAYNQADQFNASAANSASSANAGLDERARQFNADQDFQRRNAAGTGYSGLYSDSNAATSAANQRWLGGLGGNDQQNQASIQNRFEYNKPWGQQLANSLVSGGTAAAGAYLSGGIRKQPPLPGYGTAPR